MSKDPVKATNTANMIQCSHHPGERRPALICRHLLRGTDLGFFWGTDPEDPRNPCPDAWCAECDAFLQAHGGEWNDETDASLRISLVCDLCYDAIRLRNMPEDLEAVWQRERYHPPS